LMDGCCGGKGQRLRSGVGDVELFLGGAHNARRGGLCELWPMAISVTLLFRPSGSLCLVLPCGGGRFDCWAAQQHLLVLLVLLLLLRETRPCASSCSMSSRRHALMLLVLAGCPAPKSPVFSGPLTLGCPDLFSSLTAPRLLLLDRAIWISTGSVNIRHSSGPLHQAETLRCCDFDAGNSPFALLLNHLRWGAIAASDLLRPPGSAWLTKGGLKLPSLLRRWNRHLSNLSCQNTYAITNRTCSHDTLSVRMAITCP
jgi:hypothetical protein